MGAEAEQVLQVADIHTGCKLRRCCSNKQNQSGQVQQQQHSPTCISCSMSRPNDVQHDVQHDSDGEQQQQPAEGWLPFCEAACLPVAPLYWPLSRRGPKEQLSFQHLGSCTHRLKLVWHWRTTSPAEGASLRVPPCIHIYGVKCTKSNGCCSMCLQQPLCDC